MSKNGLILLTPTSIAYTGTSATVSANGSVSFSACTVLSLNGVFTSDYDNYMVLWAGANSTTDIPIYRLRASGTDATASNYVTQDLTATSTTVSGTRTAASGYGWYGYTSTSKFGNTSFFYGPFLSQPTAVRLLSVNSRDGAYLQDDASTHSLSSSYDGFTITAGTGNFTGRVAVYGMRK